MKDIIEAGVKMIVALFAVVGVVVGVVAISAWW